MDNIEDILKRLKFNLDDLDEKPFAPPTQCVACSDRRWVALPSKIGEPSYGKLVRCERCRDEVWADEEQDEHILFSKIGPLHDTTFAKTRPEGRPGKVDSASFKQAFKACVEFADTPRGGFIINGPSRTGKTHLAAAIANALLDGRRHVLFLRMSEFVDSLSTSTFEQQAHLGDLARTVPFLFMDDLSEGYGREYVDERIRRTIGDRSEKDLPTVITTRLSHDQFNARLSPLLSDEDVFKTVALGADLGGLANRMVGVPRTLLERMTFDNFKPEGKHKIAEGGARQALKVAYKTAREFARKPEGWLYFYGNPGAGKSHLAVAIAGESIKHNRAVLYRKTSDLLDELREMVAHNNSKKVATLQDFKNADLLVIEDFGLHTATAWGEEKLYQILSHRYDARLPTVITSMGALADDADRFRLKRLAELLKDSKPALREAILSRLKDQDFVRRFDMHPPDSRRAHKDD